jgi:hypothetical protein
LPRDYVRLCSPLKSAQAADGLNVLSMVSVAVLATAPYEDGPRAGDWDACQPFCDRNRSAQQDNPAQNGAAVGGPPV